MGQRLIVLQSGIKVAKAVTFEQIEDLVEMAFSGPEHDEIHLESLPDRLADQIWKQIGPFLTNQTSNEGEQGQGGVELEVLR